MIAPGLLWSGTNPNPKVCVMTDPVILEVFSDYV